MTSNNPLIGHFPLLFSPCPHTHQQHHRQRAAPKHPRRARQLTFPSSELRTLPDAPTARKPLPLAPRSESPVQVSLLTINGHSRTLTILSARDRQVPAQSNLRSHPSDEWQHIHRACTNSDGAEYISPYPPLPPSRAQSAADRPITAITSTRQGQQRAGTSSSSSQTRGRREDDDQVRSSYSITSTCPMQTPVPLASNIRLCPFEGDARGQHHHRRRFAVDVEI